jgi:hypothetical protein
VPGQLLSLAGQEHDRTIPLADIPRLRSPLPPRRFNEVRAAEFYRRPDP